MIFQGPVVTSESRYVPDRTTSKTEPDRSGAGSDRPAHGWITPLPFSRYSVNVDRPVTDAEKIARPERRWNGEEDREPAPETTAFGEGTTTAEPDVEVPTATARKLVTASPSEIGYRSLRVRGAVAKARITKVSHPRRRIVTRTRLGSQRLRAVTMRTLMVALPALMSVWLSDRDRGAGGRRSGGDFNVHSVVGGHGVTGEPATPIEECGHQGNTAGWHC
jgi:hypothetical protein